VKYLIARTADLPGVCLLGAVQNVPKRSDLRFGISYLSRWPDNIHFEMDPDFKEQRGLADCLDNHTRLLVVSERFKQALEAIPGALQANDVLPVKIVNHRKRVEKAPYYIIQQLDHPPCLDEEKVTGVRNALSPENFQFINNMVLAPEKIPPDRMLFRARQYNAVVLIREDLAERLEPLGLSGLEFHEIEGFAF
jgi:hypothetical protein